MMARRFGFRAMTGTMPSSGRVHHLSCGTLCPPVIDFPMVCHCLLIESGDGLVLVDTGFGMGDVADGGAALDRPFRWLSGAPLREEETALARIRALGFEAADVRHIVVTHLDLDHAGGLTDFPTAEVHVHARELEAAQRRSTLLERRRYVPRQLAHVTWRSYADAGDTWLGMDAIMPLSGLADDVALVPLFGHSRGHSGVAVRRPDGVWLLHAGDAYFHRSELVGPSTAPLPIRAFQRTVDMNTKARKANRERLGDLARTEGDRLRIFCAHDQAEFDALTC